MSVFPQFELSLFHALLRSTYVDSMYLVRVTPPINLYFQMIPYFFNKFLAGGGDINSLNLLVDIVDTLQGKCSMVKAKINLLFYYSFIQ